MELTKCYVNLYDIDMIISDFTTPELYYLREQCNFVGSEKAVFELRSRGVPLDRIDDEVKLKIDGVKKVSFKINRKIERVMNF